MTFADQSQNNVETSVETSVSKAGNSESRIGPVKQTPRPMAGLVAARFVALAPFVTDVTKRVRFGALSGRFVTPV